MKAKINTITKNNSDFQHQQIDVEVIYEDKDFPADHHFDEGGKRKFIFTLPYEEFIGLGEAGLTKKIKAQGEAFAELLQKNKDMETKETELKALEGITIEI